jgi:arabinan endo-1,5-alpha-L-arabinosidase
MKKCIKKLLFFILLISSNLYGQNVQTNISVHDPVMAKEGDTYYVFCTGQGIDIWSSKDMKNWKREKPVFAEAPNWAINAVPGFKGHIWAPDISYYKGTYYLYYAVSAFGKNTSCIGVATNTTLSPSSENYVWVDHGMVIQSIPGKTNWNAIDPNLALDKRGKPYLAFGSFWDGLKIVRLSDDRLKVAQDLTELPTIASRKRSSLAENPPAVDDNPVDAGGNAIEAPFIFKKGEYYYLFASIDYCCKGPKSTYKMIVGRAKDIKGPYLDKKGISMAKGGGDLLLKGDENWYGVGHNSVYTFDSITYLIFHGYDASDNGRSKLRIERLEWTNGWPAILL